MNQTENNRPLVDGVPALERKLKEVREAQAQFATFSQEQVDQIFRAAALAANHARLPLAKMAVEETRLWHDPYCRTDRRSGCGHSDHQPHVNGDL